MPTGSPSSSAIAAGVCPIPYRMTMTTRRCGERPATACSVAPLALDPLDGVDADEPPLAPQQVERPVDDDPVQPRLERAPLVEP